MRVLRNPALSRRCYATARELAVGSLTLRARESNSTSSTGAITVRGSFGQISGEGKVGPDGTITGRLQMDAASLDTKNKKRDVHLRSADFFDSQRHPQVVVTVTQAKSVGPATMACVGTLEAAGQTQPIEFSAHVEDGNAQAVTLRGELVIDRTAFSMTWRPLGVASKMAVGTVVARFVRS